LGDIKIIVMHFFADPRINYSNIPFVVFHNYMCVNYMRIVKVCPPNYAGLSGANRTSKHQPFVGPCSA
jgi:hypothetical protein